jgi:DNA-binding protein H-NS
MPKFDSTQLESMTVAEILEMRSSLEQELLKRAAELQSQLNEIELITGGGAGGKIRKSVAPARYFDSASGQSWSGRGRMARWLSEKIKEGHKKEEFFVGDEKSAKPTSPKRGRKKK